MSDVRTFPWDNSPIVCRQFLKDNYKIINTKAKSKKALICCSGNGLYFPNREQVFQQVICDEDRYEWENIVSDKRIQSVFSKIIFIRDIYKQWYINGINSSIDSMDRLIDFLKELTAGYEVSILGNSAGGYAAVAIGSMLSAKTIFNFSGQYTLCDQFDKAPILNEKKHIVSCSKYYDLLELFKEQCVDNWMNVYHFYPGKCEWDVWQASLAEKTSIRQFPMNSDLHGATIRSSCYSYILTASHDTLNQLHYDFSRRGGVIDLDLFEKAIPIKYRIPYYVRTFKKKICSKLLKL